jgi:hypothetical protein
LIRCGVAKKSLKKRASTATRAPTRKQRVAAADETVRHNIEEYGCHIYWVGDPKGKEPSFAYSIGIGSSCGAPDVIVFGLSANLSFFVINEYCRRARKQKPFPPGKRHRGFLTGYSVYIEPIATTRTKSFMLGCHRWYGNWRFKAAQIIWPAATTGVWPWELDASDWLKENQPLLCKPPVQKTAKQPVVNTKPTVIRKAVTARSTQKKS